MNNATFEVGDLIAIIGNNEAEGQHRSGYNGIFQLSHRTEPENLFVPAVAGMNLEHIFDGHTATTRELLFEPRNAPMEFRKLSETEAELHQPPTPHFGLESWTRFTLQAPHYIDFNFRGVAHKNVFIGGYIGLFWASYINAPENKSIYFRGRFPGSNRTHWIQAYTQWHDNESTFMHLNDNTQLKFAENYPTMLYTRFSQLRWEESFFFGLRKNHVFIVMFDRAEGIRFSHSPSGGGGTLDGSDTNPAWDFQFIVPKYEVDREYSFKARVVYKEYRGRQDVLEEFRRWSK